MDRQRRAEQDLIRAQSQALSHVVGETIDLDKKAYRNDGTGDIRLPAKGNYSLSSSRVAGPGIERSDSETRRESNASLRQSRHDAVAMVLSTSEGSGSFDIQDDEKAACRYNATGEKRLPAVTGNGNGSHSSAAPPGLSRSDSEARRGSTSVISVPRSGKCIPQETSRNRNHQEPGAFRSSRRNTNSSNGEVNEQEEERDGSMELLPGAYAVIGELPIEEGFGESHETIESHASHKSHISRRNDPVAAELINEEAQREQMLQDVLKDVVAAEIVDDNWKWKRSGILGCLLVAALCIVLGLLLPSRNGEQPAEEVEPLSDYDFLVQLLTPVSGESLFNQSTPQFQAINWLAFEDNHTFPIQNTSFTVLTERYIMALLYLATDGANWVSGLEFLSNSSVCEWPPIEENERETMPGVRCNIEGSVTQIFICTYNFVSKSCSVEKEF